MDMHRGKFGIEERLTKRAPRRDADIHRDPDGACRIVFAAVAG